MQTGKSRGKRSLRTHRRRCEDNVSINLKEIGISTRNWDDLESPCECGFEPISQGVS